MLEVRRRLFNLAAAVSLLLCLGAVGLGVRSVYRKDKLEYVSATGRLVLLISTSGRLDVMYNPSWPGEEGFTHIRGLPSGVGATDYSRRFLGFGGRREPNGRGFVNVPYWFIALVCAVLPMLTIRAAVRRRKARPGVCTTCGYDLRATPDRCPECGANVNPMSRASSDGSSTVRSTSTPAACQKARG
jgi:hypothetical protein